MKAAIKKLINVNVNPIIYLMFSVLSVLFVLNNDPLFLLIALLAIASNYKGRIYFLTNIISILFSIILSIQKFYMVVITCAIFFLLKIMANLFIKKNSIRRMFSYIGSTLITFAIYFMKNISFINFSDLFLSMSFAFVCFYAFHKILDNYQYNIDSIDSKDRIIIYTLFPFLFTSLELFYLMIVRVIHLLLIKSAKFSEALSSLILSCVVYGYILNISQVDILLLVLPFIFSFMIYKHYPFLVYGLFYILSNMFLLENFYTNPLFYQGLISIILAMFIPESFYISLSKLLKKQEEIKEDKSKEIDNILNYLGVVLDDRLDNIKTPLDSSYKGLKLGLCNDCNKKATCELETIIKNGIQSKYSKTERQKIVEICEYPYKLFKRTQIYNEIYLKEQKRIEESLFTQDVYKKELANLYYPLKRIDEKRKSNLLVLTSELKKEGFNLIDCKSYDNYIEVELIDYKKDDEEIILSIIESVFCRTFYFLQSNYSFSLGGYILSFSNKSIFKVDIATFSKGMNTDSCGDKLIYFKEDNLYKLILSDGMGHNKASSSLSSYLVDSLLAYSKIDSSLSRQIDTINRLIYHKSSQEMYATLDYFILDLINLKFTLFKAGSFPTFIYHEGKLKESKKNSTPLGILENVEPFAYKDFLQVGDIVIFMSDGFGEDVYDIIERNIAINYSKSISELTKILKEDLLLNSGVEDDKTLVLLKIEKCS